MAHLNKCMSAARRSGNLERVGFAQLKMFTILSDGVGADATGPLLAEIRANAIRSGSPTLLCAVHVYLAQTEALRGIVNSSQRHIRLALRILQDAPNLWLESVIENIRLALAILGSQLDVAELHAKRGASLAEKTGGAAEYAVNRGNSGFLHYMRGNFEEAIDCYECTLRLAVPGSQNHSGTLDSLARVKLAQGRLDECEKYLLNIEEAAFKPRDRQTYVYRHAQLTRAHVALRRGNIESAKSHIANVLQLATQANDRLLEVAGLIASAEVEVRRHDLTGHGRWSSGLRTACWTCQPTSAVRSNA